MAASAAEPVQTTPRLLTPQPPCIDPSPGNPPSPAKEPSPLGVEVGQLADVVADHAAQGLDHVGGVVLLQVLKRTGWGAGLDTIEQLVTVETAGAQQRAETMRVC